MKRFLATFALGRPDEPLAILDASSQLKRRSAQGTIVIAAAQAAKFVIQFASQLILARLLLPSDFGLVAMVFPIVGAIQIFNDIGLGQLVILREKLDRPFVSSLFWLNLLVGLAVAIVVIALAPVAAWFFSEPRLTLLMIASGIGMPLWSIGGISQSLLIRQMRFGAASAIGIAAALVGLFATAAAAWAGWSYWSLIFGQYCTAIASNILAWRAAGWSPSMPRLDRSALESLSFGGNFTGANLANYLTTAGDNAIIAYAYGSDALGLYDRSYRLVVQPLGQMIAPIATVAAPLLARMRGDADQYRDSYFAMLQVVVLLTVPGMATCAVFPREVVAVLLSPRWSAAAPIFAWISVGGLASAIYASALWLFLSQERVAELMRVTLIGAVVNIAAFLIGARYGPAEIAAAGAVSFLLINTPLVFFVALREGPIRPSAIIRVLAYQYGFVGVSVVLLVLLRRHLNLSDVVMVALGLLVSYAVLGAATFLSPDHRTRLTRTLAFVWRSRK